MDGHPLHQPSSERQLINLDHLIAFLSGGVQFSDLCQEEAAKFQENLLKTMIQIENTFFDLAATCQKNCLVICDRGVMDASACK